MRRLLTWLSGEDEPIEGWRSGAHFLPATGTCVNEDAIREMDRHGRCVTCGSAAMVRRGAVPEMLRRGGLPRLRRRAAQKQRSLFELIVDRERPA